MAQIFGSGIEETDMHDETEAESTTPCRESDPSGRRHARAYLALGSNQGDRAGHIEHALAALARLPETELAALSPLYESEPAYHTEQEPFANAVLEVRTALTPHELLDQLQRIEREEGRMRTFPNAPRPLDLDILDYEDALCDDERLTLPHPRLLERDFTVTPLLDISPSCTLADGTAVTRGRITHGRILRQLEGLDLPPSARATTRE